MKLSVAVRRSLARKYDAAALKKVDRAVKDWNIMPSVIHVIDRCQTIGPKFRTSRPDGANVKCEGSSHHLNHNDFCQSTGYTESAAAETAIVQERS